MLNSLLWGKIQKYEGKSVLAHYLSSGASKIVFKQQVPGLTVARSPQNEPGRPLWGFMRDHKVHLNTVVALLPPRSRSPRVDISLSTNPFQFGACLLQLQSVSQNTMMQNSNTVWKNGRNQKIKKKENSAYAYA